MFRLFVSVSPKRPITRKESYEVTAILIRKFIDLHNGDMKKAHYQKTFSHYSFSNLYPMEGNYVYQQDRAYTFEIRTLKRELLDLRSYVGLETEDVVVTSVSASKILYGSKGMLQSETPVYVAKEKRKKKSIEEYIRENILYRYVKSGCNSCDDLDWLREHVIKEIRVNEDTITVPFKTKRLKNGEAYRYHCTNMTIVFQHNDVAKEVEKIVYISGLGQNTSNGFGFMK
ncbi:hypothetical protein [Bacillus sp. AFS088145]|uniref:hypothetical protein n=1 Tax=Bacillus sp. AFS088145 TaxID=2033514 RepID=UPI000BFA0EB4|nr:hypothetical protein [Bacillus sp. AFS088145]PFH91393.1 hypothetical protein COI44_01955 [Bacillus sp. AFS088145]